MNDKVAPPQANIRPQTIVIQDRRELYKSYMPFIKGGGLFIQFNEELTAAKVFPGQKIFILFSFLESKNKVPIQGKVVWISRGGLVKGVGVAFGDTPPMKALKDNIESQVSDFMLKKEPTYTI